MPIAADLRTRFPDAFASTVDDVLSGAIADAYAMEDQTAWGSLHETAVLYKAAHLAALSRQGANAGVSSAGAGGVSVSFAVGEEAGRSRFLDLYEQLARRAFVPLGVF